MTLEVTQPVPLHTPDRPTTPAIEVRDVSMSYGHKLALDGVSFSIAPGEKVALLGPNGAGKSTLIEILAGFRSPSAGSVTVLGTNPLTTTQGGRGGVGLMLQNWQDHAKWQVGQFLLQVATSMGKSPAQARDLASRVGLGECWDTRLRALSGGQRRKVDLASALMGDPGLLILDEPTTGFDVESRREFQRLVLDVASPTTVLWATHDLVEAEAVCDRIVMLSDGHVAANDTPQELRARHARHTTVTWTSHGTRHTQRTIDNVNELLLTLLLRGEAEDLEVRRSSLEDVYLDLAEGHDHD